METQNVEKVKQVRASTSAFTETMTLDLNFHSKNVLLPFNQEEAEFVTMAKDYISQGKDIIIFIYSYRNLASTVPHQNFESEEKQNQYQNAFVELMKEKVEKLLEIKMFIEKACDFCSEGIQKLFSKDAFVTKNCNFVAISLINVIMSINYVLSAKSSTVNDFSRFKREYHFYPQKSQEFTNNILNLQNMFSTINFVANTLREKFQSTGNYIESLSTLLQFVFNEIQHDTLRSPQKYFMLNRSFLFLAYLIDGPTQNFLKTTKIKNLTKIKKQISQTPFLPLFKDCNITSKFILADCHNISQEKSKSVFENVSTDKYFVLNSINSIKIEYRSYLIKFYSVLLEIDVEIDEVNEESKSKYFAEAIQIQTLIIQGLKLLSKWTSLLWNQYCFKLENMISETEYKKLIEKENLKEEDIEAEQKELRGDKSIFERRVRFNYSSEDLHATVSLISYIKELSNFLLCREIIFSKHINFYIHQSLTIFAKEELNENELKKPPEDIKRELSAVSEVIADFISGAATVKRTKKFSVFKKKKSEEGSNTTKTRISCPNNYQMQILNCLVSKILLYNDKKKILNKHKVIKWKKILDDIYHYNYLGKLKKTVQKMSNLSFMWFKESNLSFSGCIQFPIELSLPGILSEFALNTPCHYKDSLKIFEIYNDSVKDCLTGLGQQYLFEESEAECSLLFDQFLFKISRIFVNECLDYISQKMMPFTMANDAELKAEPPVFFNEVAQIVSQRQIEIIGRKINLKSLVSQHVSNNLKDLLDAAINKIEILGVAHILEFEYFLRVFKDVCETSQKLLEMDDFEVIYNEVNESFGACNYNSRMFAAVSSSVINDAIPNFCHIRGSEVFERNSWINVGEEKYKEQEKKFERSEPFFGSRFSKYYIKYFKMYNRNISWNHFNTMAKVLSKNETAFIVNELIEFSKIKLNRYIFPYFSAISKAVPLIKAPPATFGFFGAYTAVELKLMPIDQYPPLRTNVFQSLKELGNILAIVHHFDISYETKNSMEFPDIAEIFGIEIVKEKTIFNHENEGNEILNAKKFIYPEENKLSFALTEIASQLPSSKTAFSEKLLYTSGKVKAKYENYKINRGSYLSAALYSLAVEIYQTDFYKTFRGKFICDSLSGITSTKDIASIFSTIKFIMCNSKPDKNGKTDYSIYGESSIWAVVAILQITNQENRFKIADLTSYLLELHEDDLRKENEETAAAEAKKKSRKKSKPPSILNKSDQSGHFIEYAKIFGCITRSVSTLYLKHYKPPDRFIESFENGSLKWIKDDFNEKFLAKMMGVKENKSV